MQTYGRRLIYDTHLDEQATVASIIQDDRWQWLLHTSAINNIMLHAHPDLVPQTNICDRIDLIPATNREFSVKSCWEAISRKEAEVQWWNGIWYKHHIPKCAMIQWLAYWRRLNTKDRLFKWGIVTNQECVLCHNEPETVPHLFFACEGNGMEGTMTLQW